MIGIPDLLFLSALLFCIGLYGLLTRRGIIPILMCVELMLNAVNINLVAFDRFYAHNAEGQLMALFSIAVAASEIAVGLALAFRLYQIRFTTNVDELDTLKD
ncbi:MULTISPECIES: NADH-quinone oxidoreductase subunit NuoK [Selenomonas]|uniref:NADH-quinone oxidoreductase subunit NuoK n=1 Tax=Selenomonas TaxID=970 RepID=UPI0001E097A5|nr:MULTISPECIES: NADH-quinone oxidoreductase subunit NuoK [Selenomonas]AKT54221.1 NADH dehydrogenase [Selenomonas sp. oral taxon 478]EFM23409.1 putative NADH dehydrogenase subunit K [Selenomonas sp. oral taxon 149 str. 67H29BP]